MFKFLMKNGFGSVGETARAILIPLKNFHIESNLSMEEVRGIYFYLIGQRANAASMAGQKQFNILYDQPIQQFFSTIDTYLKNEEPYKKDITIFTFLVIYLESISKREGFRGVSEKTRRNAFEVIFEETNKICPNLSFFNKENSVEIINKFYYELEQIYSTIDRM